jgi:hypothetical protein
MNNLHRLVIAIIALSIVVPVAGAEANTFHILENGSGDFPTIQAAIGDPGTTTEDIIIVHDGTYVENINFKGKAITVKSENGPEVTIIDGSNPADPNKGSVVTFNSGEDLSSVLEGFTITGGSGTSYEYGGNFYVIGGGVFCDGSSPTITNCTISNNSVSDVGGGIILRRNTQRHLLPMGIII